MNALETQTPPLSESGTSSLQILAPPWSARLAAWHVLVVAGLQVAGLTIMGWQASSVWLVFLCDDLWLAASTWVRTGWARTKAGEGMQERMIAVAGHAIIDSVTLAGLAIGLIVMAPWPDGETFARVWSKNVGFGEVTGALIALGFILVQAPSWWRADRSGTLASIDEIRDNSRLLTRFWVANLALLLGLPWMGGSSADLAATLSLVVLRSAWTLWFDVRSLRGVPVSTVSSLKKS